MRAPDLSSPRKRGPIGRCRRGSPCRPRTSPEPWVPDCAGTTRSSGSTSQAPGARLSLLIPVEILAAERYEPQLGLAEQDLLAAGQLLRCHHRLIIDVDE